MGNREIRKAPQGERSEALEGSRYKRQERVQIRSMKPWACSKGRAAGDSNPWWLPGVPAYSQSQGSTERFKSTGVKI